MTLEAFEDRIVPTVYTWVGTGGGGDWNIGTNWDLGTVPTANDTANFTTASDGQTITVGAPTSVGAITFNDTMVGGAIIISGAGPFGIGPSGVGAISNSGSATASIGAPLSNSTGINFGGTGTISLSGSDTFSGGDTIASGAKVAISNAAALGTATSIVNGTLEIDNITHTGALTLNSGGQLLGTGAARENGAITIPAAASVTFSTGASASDRLTLGAAANTINASAGTDVLNVTGSGQVVLNQDESGATGIAATDTWIVTNSTLDFSADTQLGAVPTAVVPAYLTLNGGTLSDLATTAAGVTLNINRGVTLGTGGGTFSNLLTSNLNYAGLLSGNNPFTKAGPGDFNYIAAPASANQMSSTTVAAGRYFFSVASANIFGSAPITIQTGATVDMNVNTTTPFTLSNALTMQVGSNISSRSTTAGGVLVLGGPLTLPTAGTVTFNADDQSTGPISIPATAAGLVMSGDLTVEVGQNGFGTDFPNIPTTVNSTPGAVTFGQVISGAFNFNKTGPGTLVLTNASNSFGGNSNNINIFSGILSVGADHDLGDATNAVNFLGGVRTNAISSLGTGAENTLNKQFGLATGNTNFAAVWQGTFTAPSTGTYTFGIAADDGAAIYIDGNRVVGYGTPQANGTATATANTLSLTAGPHTIQIVYQGGATTNSVEARYALGTFTSESAIPSTGIINPSAAAQAGVWSSVYGANTLEQRVYAYPGVPLQAEIDPPTAFPGVLTQVPVAVGKLQATAGFSTSRNINLGTQGGIDVTTGTFTLAGLVSDLFSFGGGSFSSGNGGITKTGAGTVLLADTGNTFTGPNAIRGGILQVNTLANSGTGGTPSELGESSNSANNFWLDGGTFQYLNSGTTPGTTDRSFTLTTSGGGIDNSSPSSSATLTLSSTQVAQLLSPTTTNRTLTLTGTNTGANLFDPAIVDAAGGTTFLNKTGVGNWIVNGTNSFSGAVNIIAGSLQVNSSAALGSLTTNTGLNVSSGASLLIGPGATVSDNRRMFLSGTGVNSRGALDGVGGGGPSSATFGLFQLLGDTTLGSEGSGADNLTLTNSIAGAGSITVVGSGGLTLNGADNTGTGIGLSGVVGSYYQITNATQATELNLLVDTDPTWLGTTTVTPKATVPLAGGINFPNVAGNGFLSSDGLTNVTLATLGSPPSGANLEARWAGNIFIPGTGTTPVAVSFQTTSDDGSVIYIPDALNASTMVAFGATAVVNNNASQSPTTKSTTVLLTPGLHAIDIEYVNLGGGGSMDAQWDPAGGSNFVDIPLSKTITANLSKTGSGLLTLNAANTYTGNTTISAGTVTATVNNTLGVPTSTSTLSIFGSAVLNLPSTAGAVTTVGIADFSQVTAGGAVVNTNPSALASNPGALVVTNTMKLSGGLTVALTGGSSFSVSGTNIAAPDSALTSATARTISAAGGTLSLAQTGSYVVPTVAAPRAFWLDADNPSTLLTSTGTVATNGATINTWEDPDAPTTIDAVKKGGAPTLITNGITAGSQILPVVRFNDGAGYLQSIGYSNTGQQISVFIVLRQLATNVDYSSPDSFGNAAQNDYNNTTSFTTGEQRPGASTRDVSSSLEYNSNNPDATPVFTPALGLTARPVIDTTIFNKTSTAVPSGPAADTATITDTDSSTSATSSLATTTSNFNINLVTLGARDQSGTISYWAKDDIAEILVYNSALDSADQTAIQNYLYNKWIAGVPPAQPSVSLPNTNFVISASTTLDFGSSTSSHTIGSVTIGGTGAGTALTLTDGTGVTTSGIIATGTGTASITGTPVTLAAGSTISVPSGVGLTIGTTIAGSSAVTKIGSGPLTLAGTNTYTGATAVNAGTLNVTGALGNTAVSVSNAGSLISLGNNVTVAGNISANASTGFASSGIDTVTGGLSATAATIDVGDAGGADQVGSLTLGGMLTADGASVFNFDFQNAGSFDTINAGSNALSLSGNPVLNLELSSLANSAIAAGTYNLITYTGHADANSFTLGSTPAVPGFTYQLNTTPSAVQLVVTTLNPSLKWDDVPGGPSIDDGTGTWSNNSPDFFDVTNGVPITYSNASGFDVAFGNGGAGATVTLSGSVTTGGLLTFATVASPYTFAGTGTLTARGGIIADASATIDTPILLSASQPWLVDVGQTLTIAGAVGESAMGSALTKTGAGTLFLDTPAPATYTGGTTVSGGKIQLGAASQLPVAGNLTLLNNPGSILDLNNFSQTIGSLVGGGNVGGNIALGTGTLTVGDATPLTSYAGVISGTGGILVKQGAGTLNLLASDTYTGGTTVSGGVLGLGAAQTLPSGTTVDILSGGTLSANFAGDLSGVVINIHSGGTLVSTVPGALNGATINILSGASFATTIADTLTGVLINDSGTLNAATAGALNDASISVSTGGTLLASIANGLTNASAILGTGVTLSPAVASALNGASITLNTGAALTPMIAGATTTTSAIIVAGGTFDVSTFNSPVASLSLQSGSVLGTTGVITSTAPYDLRSGSIGAILGGVVALNKTTTGTVTLSSANTYTGATNINAGTVTLLGSTAPGSTVAVATGATLNDSGSVGGNATLTGTGIINFTSPGAIGGTLAVTGGTLTGAETVTGLITSTSGTFTLAAGSILTAPTGVSVSGGSFSISGSIIGSLGVAGATTAVSLGSNVTVTSAFLAGTGTVNTGTNDLFVSNSLTIASGTPRTYTYGGGTGGTGTFNVQGSNLLTNIDALNLTGNTVTVSTQTAVAGLNIRAWQNTGAPNVDNYTNGVASTPNYTYSSTSLAGQEGTSTISSYANTVGQITGPINVNLNGTEWFTGGGTNNTPEPTGYATNYAVDYRGEIYIATAGLYRFQTTSDDGSALWIDAGDNPVYANALVQNNATQGATPKSSSAVMLSAGYHDILIRYNQGTGGNVLNVQWDPTGGTNFVTIPGTSPNGTTQGGFYHFVTTTSVLSPTTNINVSADSQLALPSGGPASFGAVSLAGSMLTLSGATSVAVLSVTSTGNSTLAGTPAVSIGGSGNVTVAGNLTIGAPIVDGSSQTFLNLFGTGALTLTGSDSYTGSTLVNGASTLLIDGPDTGSPAVSVDSTATLGGNSTFSGDVSASGIVAPGATAAKGSVGTLTVGNLTLGAALSVDLLGTGNNDEVVASTVGISSGTNLSLNLGTIVTGTQYTILKITGGSQALGTFNNLPEGKTFFVNNIEFQITYKGNGGDDVVLTALTGGTGNSILSTVLNGGGAGSVGYVNNTLVPGYLNNAFAPSQHSMVESVVYSFGSSIGLSASNFSIIGLPGSGTSVVPTLNLSSSPNGTVWTVTFSGAGVEALTNSIGDGEYRLSLTGVPGLADSSFDFFRLLGDMDGNGLVNIADFSTLVGTFIRATNDALYLGAADLDGDGTIGIGDISLLVSNFLHNVPAIEPGGKLPN